eukprot:TRINITY_DN785_c0_g1::TRINITY_DN785_c0_g1_i1::g.18470::m.18470 TRINITY_DN785_c0_g1::TRINITY_DN785_c0_g1_i1::g.18470  ORF type:complete len:125 (-),score=40.27,sp/Q8LGG0/FKB12_ARATH/60.71/3e-41,FKBP_C/PF00254.23/3.1e-24 TRINITY_DN785_c0_g1_i1:77-409(-)
MGVTKEVLKPGTGRKPQKGNTITVHCTGFVAATGKKFWSTKDPGQDVFSFQVGLGQVIKGWDAGFIDMSLGESARLTISSDWAYGPRGFPAWGIPPNADLIFEVEILKIE